MVERDIGSKLEWSGNFSASVSILRWVVHTIIYIPLVLVSMVIVG